MLEVKILLVFGILATTPSLVLCDEDYENNTVIQVFQEYLRINTTTGNDLQPAVQFWTRLAEEADVEISVHEYVRGYPVVVLKWSTRNSSHLGSIMLNSHMDVVPANKADGWTYGPFDAELHDDMIYGRGSQDMKSVSLQYYQALKTIKENNATLERDVYMTLMPDEEVGGASGMIPFLSSKKFIDMNVTFEMDEGTSYPIPQIAIFYHDKSVWQIQVDCYGDEVHGALFPASNTTATGRCLNVMNAMMQFRNEQYNISQTAPITNAGTYTSINLNRLSGGVANNVIPSRVILVYDIRLAISINETDFRNDLESRIYSSGDNITIDYLSNNDQSPPTPTRACNPYWNAISEAARDMNITLLPAIPPGSTDARHVRQKKIPAFGFSPMPNTPLLLHSVNERIEAATFLAGIAIYERIILGIANVPDGNWTCESS